MMDQKIETVPIYWRGMLIGHLSDIEIDMWYQGGKWLPENEATVQDFYNELRKLIDVRSLSDIDENLGKGIWIGFGVNEPTHLVYTFADGRLDARLTTTERPETWLPL
jgi:hypothetical protein